MNIIVVGLSHKTTPIEIREKISFPENKINESLEQLHKYEEIHECIIVSTCNRVEIYAVVKNIHDGIKDIKYFISSCHQLSIEQFDKHLYTHNDDEAIKHIFRVTCSLDSMVVGEPQILGQIKDAYALAMEDNFTSLILNKLMKKSFSVAKRIRTETAIAKNAVSISFAAVELAKKIFGGVDDKVVMLIGAGEMGELAAHHLVNSGVKKVLVSNRTYQRAVDLAEKFCGSPVKFDVMNDYLVETDIVISSTGAPHYVLKKSEIEKVIIKRKNKPMFLIDIAVPRDIEPTVNEIDNVYLYDIDDLQTVVNANIKGRMKEAVKAEAIIEKEVGQFSSWLSTLEVVPTIVSLREKMEEIRQTEFKKTLSKLTSISDKEKEILNKLTSSIVNKILHDPLIVLKKQSESDNGTIYVEVARKLFKLDAFNSDKE